MHFGPCHPVACAPALHNRLPPSPHLHDDGDDGDTVRSASQYRHPTPTPSRMSLHLMTRRIALVCGRYNKLRNRTDAVISHQHLTNFSALTFRLFPAKAFIIYDCLIPRHTRAISRTSPKTESARGWSKRPIKARQG
jgi:hypothetical protein